MSFLHLLLSRILKKGRFSQLWKILKRFCRQITYLVDHAIMENCLSSAPKFPPTFLLTAKISRNLRKKRANLLFENSFWKYYCFFFLKEKKWSNIFALTYVSWKPFSNKICFWWDRFFFVLEFQLWWWLFFGRPVCAFILDIVCVAEKCCKNSLTHQRKCFKRACSSFLVICELNSFENCLNF